MKTNKLTILASSALLAFSANASAVTIDLFTDPQTQLVDTSLPVAPILDYTVNGVWSSVDGSLTSILGGNRDMGISLITNPFNLATPATIQVSGGALSFSTQSSATAQGIVQWDGAVNRDLTIDQVGLGGVDITSGGTLTAFGVKTFQADAGFLFTITAWDIFNQSVAVTLASTSVPLNTAGVLSAIGFDTFQDCGPVSPGEGVIAVQCSTPGVGVDLTRLGALQVVLDPTGQFVSLDLTLGSITTVPEPSVIGLLGIGLAGIGAISGRRKQIKA